jgi:hypothetical protein
MSLSPEEVQQRASIAAHESWARTPDRSARTAAAREARWQKYVDRASQLAPVGASDEDITRRAEHLRQADLKRMALKSARNRRLGRAA